MSIFKDFLDRFLEPVDDEFIDNGSMSQEENEYDDLEQISDIPEEHMYQPYPDEFASKVFMEDSQPMITPVAQQKQSVVVMLSPYDIRTSQIVCDHIKEGHIVICNLTSSANNQRVVDYVSGGVYALEGKIEPTPVKTTFVCTPKAVELIIDTTSEAVAGTKVSAL